MENRDAASTGVADDELTLPRKEGHGERAVKLPRPLAAAADPPKEFPRPVEYLDVALPQVESEDVRCVIDLRERKDNLPLRGLKTGFF
jgi:hypothetical protein